MLNTCGTRPTQLPVVSGRRERGSGSVGVSVTSLLYIVCALFWNQSKGGCKRQIGRKGRGGSSML